MHAKGRRGSNANSAKKEKHTMKTKEEENGVHTLERLITTMVQEIDLGSSSSKEGGVRTAGKVIIGGRHKEGRYGGW